MAGADAEGDEAEPQRVGAGSHADRVVVPGKGGELLLERLQLGPEEEPPRTQDPLDGRRQLGLEPRLPTGQIDYRYHASRGR